MFTFKEIYNTYLKYKKGKRGTHNTLKFELNLCENILDLETSLNNRAYTTPHRSVCFLTTLPKLREVFTADFRDRVVQHLVTPVLEQIYEAKFIYDSYSCRVDKIILHYSLDFLGYIIRPHNVLVRNKVVKNFK